MMGKVVAAIPTIRPELCKEAVEAWRATGEFDEIWVMYDADYPTTESERTKVGSPDILMAHANLGELQFIPTHGSCIRSFFVLSAMKDPDVEWLVHLDDDVRPMPEQKHRKQLWRPQLPRRWNFSRWRPTYTGTAWPRGYPFSERGRTAEVKIVHASTLGTPDILGFDQLSGCHQISLSMDIGNVNAERVPYGHYFPMSSQAVAIHRDLFPASYFLWMGWDLPLNKFGDIWCGVILKKICDHFGWACVINEPVVLHERASDPWKNMEAEAPMLKYNEHWWKWVDAVDLDDIQTVPLAYRHIVTQMHMPEDLDQDPPKFRELREKMLAWCDYVKEIQP